MHISFRCRSEEGILEGIRFNVSKSIILYFYLVYLVSHFTNEHYFLSSIETVYKLYDTAVVLRVLGSSNLL